jgi:hypothetical protein
MPSRHHKQAVFNDKEYEKVKKVQGDKTDYRFFREAVMYYVGEAEREALAGRDQTTHQGGARQTPDIKLDESKLLPPFIRIKTAQNP